MKRKYQKQRQISERSLFFENDSAFRPSGRWPRMWKIHRRQFTNPPSSVDISNSILCKYTMIDEDTDFRISFDDLDI